MARYRVPQNLDLQDKIIGRLTLFQFMYLLIGGMIFYATLKVGPTAVFVLIGLPVGLLALALAFGKVNDQPFGRFLVSAVLYGLKPKSRVWHRGLDTSKIAFDTTKTQFQPVVRKQLDPERLKTLAGILDSK